MISVMARRSPADIPGNDIADPLLTSEPVAVERGRNEIDKNCSSRELITSVGPHKEFLQPGKMVEVADHQQQLWRGMITSCMITIERDNDSTTADTTIEVERVINAV